jgi:hypothetical protein
MSDQRSASTPSGGTGAAASATVPSSRMMQHLVDQAANFNIFSMPVPGGANAPIRQGGSGSVVGIRIQEALHRFDVITLPPAAGRPLTARNIVGEPVGEFRHRWMVIPEDFVAAPYREPPPTALDPSRPQRIAMLDSVCRFGGGEDGFRGFGAGHTLPMPIGGQSGLLFTAVGAIIEGFGKFRGHEEGTYVYCGSLSPDRGFTGSVMLRVMDRQGTFQAENALSEPETWHTRGRDFTYILIRGQAVPSDPVRPNIGPNGQPVGLIVVQDLQLLELDFEARGRGGLQTTDRAGAVIGQITATINFNPAAPGGTNLDPIPFTTFDEFVFWDQTRTKIGSFTANSTEGRVFHTQLAGQPGIRFGGVGEILNGTGLFEGIRGLMTDNSVVVFTPHVSASVYVLRVFDPDGRFRATVARR